MSGYELINPSGYERIMAERGVGSLLAKIIAGSGWDPETVNDLLKEPADNQPDPALQPIRERIALARDRGEKVFVAGDYDTDGICATAIIVRLLRELKIAAGYYIPDRFGEGYGLSKKRALEAITKGYGLVITVDNGVKAQEALLSCRDHQVDTIVIDHHALAGESGWTFLYHPTAAAAGLAWLCGGGLSYQLVKCFPAIDPEPYLPLAMAATIGDMMSLRGANRWIVKAGLQALNRGKAPALKSLLAHPERKADEQDIAFQVVPKLNSIGRLADRFNANQVVRFLLLEDPGAIARASGQFTEANSLRRELTEQLLGRIKVPEPGNGFLVFYEPDFHPGIVGLAANRLSRDYNLPVMVAGERGGIVTGSLRSPGGLDLMECLAPLSDILVAYGGHAQAAGISFRPADYPRIRDYLVSYRCPSFATRERAVRTELTDFTSANCAEVLAHRPYGEGLRLPLLDLHQPEITGFRPLGKRSYLKWDFGPGLSGVYFSSRDCYDEYAKTAPGDFIGTLQEDSFRGSRNYQLRLADLLK